jgi:hypothetical protein
VWLFPLLARRHETVSTRQQDIWTLDIPESCGLEPGAVFVFRVGLARIIEIDEIQITAHGHGGRRPGVIKNLAENVECAARTDGRTGVLDHPARILTR